jgi:cytochrome c peroxidase
VRIGKTCLLLGAVSTACADPLVVSSADSVEALPAAVVDPSDNVSSPEKIELGRLLFWDPVLSGDRDVACATCHHPEFAYADGVRVSIGVGGTGLGPARRSAAAIHATQRNSMSILDVAWNGISTTSPERAPDEAPMFWDSRDASLEAQALRPIVNREEMRGEAFGEDAILPEVLERLGAIPEYALRFEAVFGPAAITEQNLARAIASFERTIVDRGSSFDRFMAGDDGALSHTAKRGLVAFINDGCSKCHSGPLLSDFALHNLGVPDAEGAKHDPGDGTERFRTPSLRNVTRTAPYMHNGSLATLEDVLEFYQGIDSSDPKLDGFVGPTGDLAAFVAFFEALGDGQFDRSVPEAVPSGLLPGGSIR